jgi:hypothetical protein
MSDKLILGFFLGNSELKIYIIPIFSFAQFQSNFGFLMPSTQE